MLLTSYLAKSARALGAVSIARFPPKWYTGAGYLAFAPPAELLKIRDWEAYRRRYREDVLAKLDTDEVLRDMENLGAGNDIILLCFEKDRSHCHRGLVAEWFHETRGIAVPELGTDATTQRTF